MSSISSDDDYDASARSSSDGNRPLPPLEVAVEPKDDGFVDNYFIDDDHEHSLSERIVHYVGGYVQPEHWLACKATLVFHAGAMTSKSVVTNKAAMEQYCLRTYIALVGSLDSNFFNDNARGFFLHSFKKKDQPMTAHALLRNYNDCRSKMRSVIIPLLPANYATMKSGKGFHETFNQVFVDAYRKELMRTKSVSVEEANQVLPPPFWEYKKLPWFLGLCVKIFRKDPQLAPDVKKVLSDKTNETVSRAKLIRARQYRSRANFSSSSSPPLSSSDEASNQCLSQKKKQKIKSEQVEHDMENRKRIAWARVSAAKALQVSSKVAFRLGRIEELTKTIELLDKMRSVIGESVYMTRVDAVLASIPDPTSYASEVVAGDPDDEEVQVLTEN
jgi:hypothetical protein